MNKQGTADSTTVVRANHQTRGGMSPLGGGQRDPYALHRDEDVASSQMQRTKAGPATNRAGFITPIPGRFPTASED